MYLKGRVLGITKEEDLCIAFLFTYLAVLGIDLRALCMLSEQSTTNLCPKLSALSLNSKETLASERKRYATSRLVEFRELWGDLDSEF